MGKRSVGEINEVLKNERKEIQRLERKGKRLKSKKNRMTIIE